MRSTRAAPIAPPPPPMRSDVGRPASGMSQRLRHTLRETRLAVLSLGQWGVRRARGVRRTVGPLTWRTCLLPLGMVTFLVPLAARTAIPAAADGGYELSVYYTPLEQYHPGGSPVTLPGIDTYPGDFIDKVVQEGNGKTRTGAYLNWAGDGGFWLDTAPRGAQGTALVAFQSSASTRMAFGTRFVVTDCGQPRIDDAVCQRLRAARWQIDDRFEDPSIPPNQIDLYLGEEDGPTFESGPWWIYQTNASISLTPDGVAPASAGQTPKGIVTVRD